MTTINCAPARAVFCKVIAPTWETAVEIILLTLEHGGPDMRRPARTELLRLARAMDEINKQSVRADLNNLFDDDNNAGDLNND